MILPSEILISVEPRFLEGFLDGSKRVELRRRRLNIAPGTRTWVYGKAPYARVAAAGIVSRVVSGSPARIWDKYGDVSGVSRGEFREYFQSCSEAYALVFKEIARLKRPASLTEIRKKVTSFQPPQFFKHLRAGSPELDLFLKCLAFSKD